MSKRWTEEVLVRIDSSFKDFPPSLYGRILTEQINIFSHLMRIISITGLITAASLLSAFWPFSGKELILTTALGLAVTYVAIIRATFAWSREPEQTTRARQFMRASNRLVFALGTLWAVLVVQLTMIATADQRSLVYGVTIGLVSTAVLVVPLSAAAAFWIPTTIGAFTAHWVTGRPIDIMTGMCLFGYSVLILFSGLYLNRKLCERALNEMKLQEQGEVIGMLLRDFEESSSDWLWETDERLLINHVSARFCEAMRMPKEALLGRSLQSMIGYARPLRGPARDPVSRIIRCVSNRVAFSNMVLPVRIDREEHWWSLTGKPMFDNRGRFVGYRGVGSDVTAIKLSEGQVARLASYDSLTDLPNRTVLATRLQQACFRFISVTLPYFIWIWTSSRRSTIAWVTRSEMLS